MEQEEKYLKIVRVLKGTRPVLNDKDHLTDEIMQHIGETKQNRSVLARLDELLFDWANSVRWRLTMAAASIFLVGFFFHQQLIIEEQLEHMEKQLSKTGGVTGHERDEPGIIQEVMLKMVLGDRAGDDSIKVSRHDMEIFLKDYLKVMGENKALKRNADEPFIEDRSQTRESVESTDL